MTSQNRSARESSSSASKACSRVVPDRGSPVAKSGAVIRSAAERQACPVGDEMQTARQQFADRAGGCPRTCLVEFGAVQPVDDQCHARGQGVIAEVGEPRRSLRFGDEDVRVQGCHDVLPVSCSSASSTSRTLRADSAA